MKKLFAALAVTLYLTDVGAFAALPDLEISKMSYNYLNLFDAGIGGTFTWPHDHYTLHCKLSADTDKKMSFRVKQYYAPFGRAEVTFDGGAVKQTGSLTATLSASEADLVIHDIEYNGNWLEDDAIIFYNDSNEALHVKGCELTSESGSPIKIKGKQKSPSLSSTVTPPANTSPAVTVENTKPSTVSIPEAVSTPPVSSDAMPVGIITSDSTNPGSAPASDGLGEHDVSVIDTTNPA